MLQRGVLLISLLLLEPSLLCVLGQLVPIHQLLRLELLKSSVLGSALLTLDLTVKMVLPMTMVSVILYSGMIPKYASLA